MRRYQYPLALLVGLLSGSLLLVASRVSVVLSIVIVGAAAGLVGIALAGQARGPFMVLLACTIPLHLDKYFMVFPLAPGSDQTGAVCRISASDLVLIVLVALWLADIALRGWNRIHLHPDVTLPALLFFLTGIVSILVAPDPRLVVYESSELAKGLLIYLCLANCVRNHDDLRWILAGLLATIFFQSSLAIYQGITGRAFGLSFLGEQQVITIQMVEDQLSARPTGTLWHTNHLSMYLGMVLPIPLAVFLVPVRLRLRLVAGAVFSIGFAALVYTLSRGAWLGLLASGSLLVIFALRRHTLRPSVLCATSALFVAAILVFNLLTGGVIVKRLTGDDGGAAMSRLPLMRGAAAVIAEHPILGSGLGNYQITIQTYDVAGEYTYYGYLPIVHNVFLLFAAETGLLGLGAFLWLLAALGWRGLGVIGSRNTPSLSADATDAEVWLQWGMTAGLLGSLAHVLVHNMVDFGLVGDIQLFLHFWLLSGLTVALTTRPIITTQMTPPARQQSAIGSWRG